MSIAEADDKGQAYLLLCRIVQGRPNVVHAGSHWFGSRMEQIRSVGAVDDLFNPSWYVIWRPVPIPVTVNMQKVHKEFKRFLPSSELQVLETSILTWGTHIISPKPSVSLLVLQCSLVQSLGV
uniref:PARP catalytic domain-containing protein n=1 Tax=Arundo donax TaxID=35708 RepID=A0A0A9GEF8_ARUDO